MFEDLLYKRLPQLRAQKGVSARDMSLSIGQSENYINMIENRNNLPSMQAFFYICEYFGITASEFFDEGVENPKQNRELQEKLKRLSPQQAEHVLALVDDLLNK